MDKFTELLGRLSLDDSSRKELENAFKASTASSSNHQADLRDEIRTVAMIVKPNKPKPYKGELDAIACLNFIENQEEYYEIMRLSNDEWVKYTSVNLEDDAKAWWRDSGLKFNTPWKDFRKAFIDAFTPPNTDSAARDELAKLRQGKMSVAEYTSRFRRLMRLAPSLDNKSTIWYYTGGLEPRTSQEVRLRQPETIHQAIHQATIVHSILFPAPPTTVGSTATPTISDMAMDLDNIRLNAHKNRQPLRKLSEAERAELIRTRGCFKCRRPGHRASECRSAPSPGRRLHSIEVHDGESDLGKATGEL
jgi:hypothetical protein